MAAWRRRPGLPLASQGSGLSPASPAVAAGLTRRPQLFLPSRRHVGDGSGDTTELPRARSDLSTSATPRDEAQRPPVFIAPGNRRQT